MTHSETQLDFDTARLRAAHERVRRELLAERVPAGHWTGELASSALSTATAVSALALVRKNSQPAATLPRSPAPPLALDRLIEEGADYLTRQQNDDGGFGDTDLSHSNIATTYLVIAALHLAGRRETQAEVLARAETYIERAGGLAGLRQRYGVDKTFVVPIMTNLALAGLCDWAEISPLPFELACVPQSWYRLMSMPVVSYAIPALVAIGQAHFFHRPPWNPLARVVRSWSVAPSLRVLQKMQPESGGYLEATPLTSFVLMSLAATGRAEHPVARSAVDFLVASVREDGSWPIDTNLATWVTSLSLNALAVREPDIAALLGAPCLDWLLSCQHQRRHPFTGADPGGWGWTDLSGAVPDADDTPGALLALDAWRRSPSCTVDERTRIEVAAAKGLVWLKGLQNRDGGWPTFCRGWGKLPFDRSGTDLTAHALRAAHAWRELSPGPAWEGAMARGLSYLSRKQNADGSWSPLWFGNQDHPTEDNPVYGTSKVLLAYRDLNRLTEASPQRGIAWLVKAQNADGGWGSGVWKHSPHLQSSLEETGLAVETLAAASHNRAVRTAVARGCNWLCERVLRDEYRQAAPIGFYFAKLWYHERLYPSVFTLGALAAALRAESRLRPADPADTTAGRQ